MAEWKTIETKTLFKNQWFDIKEQKVAINDSLALEGVIVLQFPDWVNVVALDLRGEVLLERNYRHGLGRATIETPSGTVEESDTSPEAAARRELAEETGYEAGEWIYLGKSLANAQLQNNHIHHFLAQKCFPKHKPQAEFDGAIEFWTEPMGQALDRVAKGQIENSYIVEGLLRAQLFLSQHRVEMAVR